MELQDDTLYINMNMLGNPVCIYVYINCYTDINLFRRTRCFVESHSLATKFIDFHKRFRGLSDNTNKKTKKKKKKLSGQTAAMSSLEIRQKKFVSVAALVH